MGAWRGIGGGVCIRAGAAGHICTSQLLVWLPFSSSSGRKLSCAALFSTQPTAGPVLPPKAALPSVLLLLPMMLLKQPNFKLSSVEITCVVSSS